MIPHELAVLIEAIKAVGLVDLLGGPDEIACAVARYLAGSHYVIRHEDDLLPVQPPPPAPVIPVLDSEELSRVADRLPEFWYTGTRESIVRGVLDATRREFGHV